MVKLGVKKVKRLIIWDGLSKTLEAQVELSQVESLVWCELWCA